MRHHRRRCSVVLVLVPALLLLAVRGRGADARPPPRLRSLNNDKGGGGGGGGGPQKTKKDRPPNFPLPPPPDSTADEEGAGEVVQEGRDGTKKAGRGNGNNNNNKKGGKKKGPPVIPGTDEDSDPLWLGWNGILVEGSDLGDDGDATSVDPTLCSRAICAVSPPRGRNNGGHRKGGGGGTILVGDMPTAEENDPAVEVAEPGEWVDPALGDSPPKTAADIDGEEDEEYDPALDLSEEYHYDPLLLGRRGGEMKRMPMKSAGKGPSPGMAKMGKNDVLDKNARRLVDEDDEGRNLQGGGLAVSYPDWTTGAQIVVADEDLPSGQACDGSALRSLLVEVAQTQHGHSDALSLLASALGTSSDENSVDAALATLCSGAAPIPQDYVPFKSVSGRGYQFDENYFHGGTSWNHGLSDVTRSSDMGRLGAVEEAVHTLPIEFPSYMPDFEGSCDRTKTVMCCFVHEMDAATGHLSPIAPEKANADVCYHDMAESPTAARVYNGFAVYRDGREFDQGGDNNDARCVGFTWPGDGSDPTSDLFLGNALVQAGMIDSAFAEGLAGNVPGAPLCGCLERMTSVTKSDCTKTVPGTAYVLPPPAGAASAPSARRGADFRPCGADLLAHMNQVHSNDSTPLLDYASSKLVGEDNCASSVRARLVEKKEADPSNDDGGNVLRPYSYATGTAWWSASSALWTPLIGKGDLYYPDEGSEYFRRLWQEEAAASAASTSGGRLPIVRRVCKSCAPSYRDLYYVRLTPIPSPDLDLFEAFKNRWTQKDNVMGVDFRIYSDYESAAADDTAEAWTHCDYSDLHGFPFECGPEEGTAVEKQWTCFTYGGTYAEDVALYLEKLAGGDAATVA